MGKKVLIVVHAYYPSIGGTEHKIRKIANYLKKHFKVKIFTTNVPTPHAFVNLNIPLLKKRKVKIDNIEVIRFNVIRFFPKILYKIGSLLYHKKLPLNDFFRCIFTGPILPSIIPSILKEKPDIVISASLPFLTLYYCAIARVFMKFKFVVIPCVHPFDKWCFDRESIKFVFNKADKIWVNSEFEKNYIVSRWKIKKEKISILGDFVNLSKFATKEDLKKRFGIKQEKVVGFIARHEKEKGIFTLLTAMKEVWKKMPSVKLIIAGKTTPHTKFLEKEIEKMPFNLKKNIIKIYDFKDKLKPLIFNTCDIVVLPSSVESFGIVYLEAWSCSKPVIACNVEPVNQIVTPKEGILVPPDNSKILADAILKLLQDDKLRAELGNNGRKKVERFYSEKAFIEKMKTLINTL